jgi:hypothetical protein
VGFFTLFSTLNEFPPIAKLWIFIGNELMYKHGWGGRLVTYTGKNAIDPYFLTSSLAVFDE